MRQDRFTTNSNYAHFALAEIFRAKNTANIRIHLNWSAVPSILREEFARKVALRFRNSISRFYYPKNARKGCFATCVIHLHKEVNAHLHILVEIPDERTVEDVRQFVRRFIQKPRRGENNLLVWDCIPPKYSDDLFYVEEVEDLIGSLIYNQRHGLETALVF